MPQVRPPAVAGSFYPSGREELVDAIKECFLHPVGPGVLPPASRTEDEVSAFVVPHAGYQYSGPVAAHSYLRASAMPRPELVVIVGPNHYGVGPAVSTFGEGVWETPVGRAVVDKAATDAIVSASDLISVDPSAQRMEHSIEVQLPFLQYMFGESVPFLPVCLLLQDADTASEVGKALASLAKGRKTIIIASSDFTHYEGYEEANRRDASLIRRVTEMDPGRFYDELAAQDASACGYGAVASVIEAAMALGLGSCELLKYANSGDTAGDKTRVVGYASLRFFSS